MVIGFYSKTQFACCLHALVFQLLLLTLGCSAGGNGNTPTNFTLNGAGSGATLAQSTPTAAFMQVYQFAVSERSDCSQPLLVIDNSSIAVEFDMLASPEIGRGTIPNGTYPCVIMSMSPTVSVLTSDGACADSEFEQNICGGSTGNDSFTQDLEGRAQTCDAATDKAYLYMSVASTADQDNEDACINVNNDDEHLCNAWEPPTAANPNRGVPLGAALVVSGNEVGVFTMSNLVVNEEGNEESRECGLQKPDFTFASSSR